VSYYEDFLNGKRISHAAAGFSDARSIQLNKNLFDWQRDLVHWALRVGRADLWCDCGLGKTIMSLDWARVVHERTNKSVLILTPLAVALQTKHEGEKFGIEVTVCKSGADVRPGINVANYERLDKFTPEQFGALVCDEVSILKSYEGSTRKAITDFAARLPYRLGASATPAPNDFMELGTQSEFVGSLTRSEMLATFFVHDGGETSKWRLKRHAVKEYFEWISKWAAFVRKPSDLGYSDVGFVLPPLNIIHHTVESQPAEGDLFTVEARTLNERRGARRASMDARIGKAADLAVSNKEAWVVWCGLNSESTALTKEIPDAVEVTGSMSIEEKEENLEAFSSGQARVVVTKGSIAGFGLNWQHCRNMTLFPDDSWERYFQQTRRCWRFGQTLPVNVHVIASQAEGAVVQNIKRKEADAERMAEGMVVHMKDLMRAEVVGVRTGGVNSESDLATGEGWAVHLGDCISVLGAMPDESVGYSIFSPPFASLYTYSDALADMGNCRTHDEFYEHMRFMVPELFRVLQPGRNLSFHCMNLPASKERDGFIGIHDFRGHLIRIFQDVGFIFHSEVCIWKDPVTAMQRTKAIGLLYKQLRKDSTISRQGIPDYLVTMRKPGLNAEPVTKVSPPPGGHVPPNGFTVQEWQKYASPVWDDINPSDTLQRESAREQEDERHICPLQLEVIRRGVRLWTNPGDVVLDPFAGIGSTGYVALGMGRQFLGAELKRSYWEQAVANLKVAHHVPMPLFAEAPENETSVPSQATRDAIAQCVSEQASCAKSFPDPGAIHGAEDWVKEEVILRLESGASILSFDADPPLLPANTSETRG
jgi:superfamily II DNA or RNA helicase